MITSLTSYLCVPVHICANTDVCNSTLLDFHAEAPLEGAFSGFSRGGGATEVAKHSHTIVALTHTQTQRRGKTQRNTNTQSTSKGISADFFCEGLKNVEHSSKVQNDLSKSALMTVLRLKCGNSWYSSKLLWFSQRKTARASDML